MIKSRMFQIASSQPVHPFRRVSMLALGLPLLYALLFSTTGCASIQAKRVSKSDAGSITLTAIGSSFLEEEGSVTAASARNLQWDKLLEATGKGLPSPQAATDIHKELTALEAAKYRALAELAEKLRGARVTRISQVRDMAFAGEEVAIEMSAVVAGSHIVRENFDRETGIAEVTLRVGVDAEGNMVSQNNVSRLAPISLPERKARAEQAARIRAMAALREQIGEIYIAEEVLVRDLFLVHQHARQHVEGMIENVEFSEPEWVDRVQCNVEARIKLTEADIKRLSAMTEQQ